MHGDAGDALGGRCSPRVAASRSPAPPYREREAGGAGWMCYDQPAAERHRPKGMTFVVLFRPICLTRDRH
jgi:hypothetical protein